MKDVTQSNRQIEDRRIVYEINKRRSENLVSFQKDIENIQLQNDILKNMFINETNQLSFFRDLENIAQSNSLNLNYNLEEASKKSKSPKEVLINISLEGKYNNVLKFIAGLEALDYYIKFTSFSFKSTTIQNIQVTIQAITYWQ